jgi:hypothetical protein
MRYSRPPGLTFNLNSERERSDDELLSATGAAGSEQSGKDAGTHQDRWDSYEGLPEYWNHGDRDPYAPKFLEGCSTGYKLYDAAKS